MNQKSVFIGSDEYQCIQFYCSDRSSVGVDVRGPNGKHFCEVLGVSIPEIDDESSNILFDRLITNEIESV